MKMQTYSRAAMAFEQAHYYAPENAQYCCDLGKAHRMLNNFEEAKHALQRAVKLDDSLYEAWRNLGLVHVALGQSDAALASYAEARKCDPQNSSVLINIGNLLKSLGDKHHAIAAYKEALSLQPDCADSHRQLSLVKAYTQKDETLIADMTQRYHEYLACNQNESAITMGLALAKAHRDRNEQAAAWEYLHMTRRAMREKYLYDGAAVAQWFDAIMTAYSAPMQLGVATDNQCSDREFSPIFIVGMPRSGTSLIEQILASHPQIYGAGELNDIQIIVQRTWPQLTGASYPKNAEKIQPEQLEQLEAEYLNRMKAYAFPPSQRITDKMPGNFRYLGVIYQLFPQAKIVHCVRNPLDNCVSIYQHYFADRHRYANDLNDLADYYKIYQELMAHWHSVLPENVILDVSYEDLVSNQRFHTRRLLDFCNISWDDACLAFHKTQRQVTTASAVQVRQPLYASSVNRWRNEAEYVQPLVNAFKV
ncbi:MAG: sulfotransferase [Alphaproteobacteria bacterium]|nr:sulfotransferase [Alphaproteobacteria bacterium]